METLAAQVCDFGLMKAEVIHPGGFGRMIAFGMTRDLFFGAPDGVSRHMHVTLVNTSGVSSLPNDVEYHPREGESLVLGCHRPQNRQQERREHPRIIIGDLRMLRRGGNENDVSAIERPDRGLSE